MGKTSSEPIKVERDTTRRSAKNLNREEIGKLTVMPQPHHVNSEIMDRVTQREKKIMWLMPLSLMATRILI